MRVFLAGATGVIGRPLIPQLLDAGHEVTCLARTSERSRALEAQGVETAVADAFDGGAIHEAVVAARPEVLIHQLTALPKDMSMRNMRGYTKQVEPTNRLRVETTPHFLAAAREAGARRVIFQSISFIVARSAPTVDETAPLLDFAPANATATMERYVTTAEALEGIVLRYGFFYGPGTYYAPDGAMVKLVRKRQLPIIGNGEGRASFIHVDDAAAATVHALDHGAPGIYNITDDHPAPQHEWVPELAKLVGAPKPRRLPAWLVRLMAGPYPVALGTVFPGNSNAKARAEMGWEPQWPDWHKGFAEVLAGAPDHAAAPA
jgi:nucleoside-diphosphate-sugar epimerase